MKCVSTQPAGLIWNFYSSYRFTRLAWKTSFPIGWSGFQVGAATKKTEVVWKCLETPAPSRIHQGESKFHFDKFNFQGCQSYVQFNYSIQIIWYTCIYNSVNTYSHPLMIKCYCAVVTTSDLSCGLWMVYLQIAELATMRVLLTCSTAECARLLLFDKLPFTVLQGHPTGWPPPLKTVFPTRWRQGFSTAKKRHVQTEWKIHIQYVQT